MDMPAPDSIPPLEFAAKVLEAEGALVEVLQTLPGDAPGGEAAGVPRIQALLPERVAAALTWPEEVLLSAAPPARASEQPRCDGWGALPEPAAGDGGMLVDYGTPALEQIIKLAQADGRSCAFRLEAPSPSRREIASDARHAFQFRTRVRIRFGETEPSLPDYLIVHFAVSARSEEVHESQLAVVINETTLAPVPALLGLLSDRTAPLHPVRGGAGGGGASLAGAWSAARKAAVRESGVQVGAFLAAMERRRDRDAERLYLYFEAMAREARERRGRGSSARVQERLRAIQEEYQRKVHDLGPQYTLRVGIRAIAAARLRLPALTGTYHLQWRTSERALPVIWNAPLQAFEPLACDVCGAGGFRFAVDDGLRIVCEACA